VNLAATPAKAAPGVINRVLLSVRAGKRWLNAWSLECNPRAFEFPAWSDFDDRHG
jgi:hypothetical protein